jgi:hypothetical protein
MYSSSKRKTNNRNQQSIYSLLCNSDDFSPDIDKDEKNQVTVACDGSGINIIDCQHNNKDVFIADVDGLNMLSKPLGLRTSRDIGDIRILPPELFRRPASMISDKVVGIALKDIFTKKVWLDENGFYRIPKNIQINKEVLNMPVFQGKDVVLFSTGHDVLIETLWWDRYEIDLISGIASMGFYAVTGMNFSLFLGECPFAQALNINKSLCYCNLLERKGVYVIPHVYAVNDFQRKRWINYISINKNIKYITINTQLQRDKYSMIEVAITLESILNKTDVDVILHGRHKRLPNHLTSNPRVHIANSGTLKKSAITKKALPIKLLEGLQKFKSADISMVYSSKNAKAAK